MTAQWTQDEIRRKVSELGDWFQNMDLCGVQTAPHHFLGDYPSCKWQSFSHALPADLSGKSVLDIGCNAGFYSMEMKRRGADRVVGIDTEGEYLAQAKFAADVNNLEIDFQKLSAYDVGLLGEQFDFVLFMGVMYHLRHPLLALDLIHEHVTRDLLLFQSMLRGDDRVDPVRQNYDFWTTKQFDSPCYPKLHFIEHKYADDPTNWWAPNRACAEAMLRSAGFVITAHPEEEVYLCRKGERPQKDGPVYPSRGRKL